MQLLEEEHENNENIIMYELQQLAQSLKLAQKMECERVDYHNSLYDFSYGISNLTEEPNQLGSTASLALYIIDQKKAYEMRVNKLHDRYERYRGLLKGLNEIDRSIITNFAERGESVPGDELRACINRITPYLDEMEEARGKALDHEALLQFRELRSRQRKVVIRM